MKLKVFINELQATYGAGTLLVAARNEAEADAVAMDCEDLEFVYWNYDDYGNKVHSSYASYPRDGWKEMLVEHEGGARKNICVPNVSFSMLNHEADLIVVNKNHYATEFEIKRSYEDFVVDFAKKHRHEAEWIYRFVYVLPLSIKDKAMKFLEDTDRKDSTCIWFYSEEPWIAEKIGIPHNPKGRKMYLEEILKLARLGVIRYWNLRDKTETK